jgi:dipeptidyl aminopeptidase/acylaminoacyl peptidase
MRLRLSQIAHVGDARPGPIHDDVEMARKLAVLLFCLLALPASASAGTTDYGRVAYVTDRNGNDEIYSTRIDTYFDESNLTNNPADDRSPAYSADGSRIAFVSDRDRRSDLWVMNWDGSNPHKITTGDTGSSDADPAWSPDGQKIAFSSSRGAGSHLWIVNLADGSLRQLTTDAGTSPAWSPDGSRIAYAGNGAIRVVAADGSDDHQLTYCFCAGAAGSPTWSRDGSYLIFARDDDGSSNVRQLYFVTASGGGGIGGIPITTGAYNYDHPTFSPDGSLLAFQRQDAAGGNAELYMELGPGADTQFPVVTGPGRNFSPSWGLKYQPPPPPPDTTPPTITITRPTANTDRTDVYTIGQVVLADYSCADADSGIRHCEGTVPSGEPIDTRSIGTYEFTVFAADQAGNPFYRRTHYAIVYSFDGFTKPIAPDGALTDMKAGDGVPLKFSLHGAYGLDAVTGTTQQPINCATRTALDSPAAAAGTLTYNASQDRYMFAWSTTKSWSGGCRAVTVTLRDGTAHRADIRFTK